VQISLCGLIVGIGGAWYGTKHDDHAYLEVEYNVIENIIINFFSYFLLLNTLIPISLVVTLEFVKVFLSMFIFFDSEMVCIERNRTAKVSSTSIIEELGQVDYIFSDKTGTLTRNVMEFKLF
jgi:P-type E1-E2 ATPase